MQKEQLLHPSSIIELISFLRVLLLKMFKVFTDVKSGGNFRHNLGPRSGLSRILPTTISADWKIIITIQIQLVELQKNPQHHFNLPAYIVGILPIHYSSYIITLYPFGLRVQVFPNTL